MKWQVIVHHWGGGVSILTYRNRTEWSERTCRKHITDLAARNVKTNEFKALHLCKAGDIWGYKRLTK